MGNSIIWTQLLNRFKNIQTPLKLQGIMDDGNAILMDGDVDLRMEVYSDTWKHLKKRMKG